MLFKQYGNVKINVKEMNIDALSMSGHKFYGPKGIGAIYVKDGVNFLKLQNGGHQEKDKRSGTENVPGIVGIGKAIELAYENFDYKHKKLQEIKDYYLEQVKEKINDIKVNGDLVSRLPGNMNISFKDVDGDALLFNLDEKGICASTGSACSSGSSKASHVLSAIGVSENYIDGTLRTTFGAENTREEIDFLVESLAEIVDRLRKIEDECKIMYEKNNL